MPRRTKLTIPGMCNEGPPAYAEQECRETDRLTPGRAAKVLKNEGLYCVHHSTIREIRTAASIRWELERAVPGFRVPIQHIHQVPDNTLQDPAQLWLRDVEPGTGRITVANPEEDPWDVEQIMSLDDDERMPYMSEAEISQRVEQVIRHRAQEREFSDEEALKEARKDVGRAVRCVSARASRIAAGSQERTNMAMDRLILGIPVEMLDRSYNLRRIENNGIIMSDDSRWRSYQPFMELGIAPPSHQLMADIIISEETGRAAPPR